MHLSSILQNIILLISSQAYCLYCVLCEDGQVSQNISYGILNYEKLWYTVYITIVCTLMFYTIKDKSTITKR